MLRQKTHALFYESRRGAGRASRRTGAKRSRGATALAPLEDQRRLAEPADITKHIGLPVARQPTSSDVGILVGTTHAHKLIVLAGGAALLVAWLRLGHAFGGSMKRVAWGANVFVPLSLLLAATNMSIRVSRGGDSVAEEAPIFLVIFGVPAAVTALAWWQLG